MTYFADLSPCTYFGKWESMLVSVGWLDADHPFERGDVDDHVFDRLISLLANPWQPSAPAGYHPCPFCRFTGGPTKLRFRHSEISLGTTNLFLPSDKQVFVAPSTVAHYIDAHGYKPPAAFERAVLQCAELKWGEYLDRVAAFGLRVVQRLE